MAMLPKILEYHVWVTWQKSKDSQFHDDFTNTLLLFYFIILNLEMLYAIYGAVSVFMTFVNIVCLVPSVMYFVVL